jgi:hypothetical protein
VYNNTKQQGGKAKINPNKPGKQKSPDQKTVAGDSHQGAKPAP